MVEVQKLKFVLRFCFGSRNPQRGSAWSRRKNSRSFCDSVLARATICGKRGAKTRGVFTISAVLARPCAGIGVVAVQKLVCFATLVVRNGPRELSRGSCACSRDRRVAGSIPPWSAGGLRKLHGATCIEQLAQSNLHRPVCAEHLAQSSLHKATCAEQLAQSNLHRATCTEQRAQSNLQGAACTEQLARSNLRTATCTQQLAQSNLRRATCTDQFAQSTLPRATCSEWSRGCDAFGPTVV